MSQPRRQAFTGYIPEEIIIEILSWASVKTLLRSKSVCKSWKSLISSVSFVRKHLDCMLSMDNNHSRRYLILADGSRNHLQSLSTDSLLFSTKFRLPPNPRHVLPLDKPLHQRFSLVGSCHGLILLHNLPAHVLLLWNPSIREFKILPHIDHDCYSLRFYQFGLGFDSLTNDYKVIEFFCCGNGWQLGLYSLKANSWRSIQDFPYKFGKMQHRDIVGNYVFWNVPHERNLISFNFVKETFHELPLPQDKNIANRLNLSFGVSAGNLYLLYRDGSYVDIWRMNENGGKELWCKQFSFLHPKGIRDAKYFPPKLLYVSEDEVMLGYNKQTAVHNKLKDMSWDASLIEGYWHTHHSFGESLVSLKC